MIDGAEVAELAPALADRDPSGGYLFYDCQTDDVRLVLTVLAEAERFGAVPVNRVEAVALTGPTARACATRPAAASSRSARRNVVNATGVWADRLRPEELHDEAEVPVIRPEPRHAHAAAVRAAAGLGRRDRARPAAGARCSCCPWLGRTLVGTTDNDYDGDIEHVRPAEADVEYLLDAVNAFFGTALGRGDVAGAYAGVRPLISSGDPRKSVDISRKAELYETSSGMVTITGGKLTTWRRMAKLAVDRIVEREGRDAPCRTHEIPLGMAVDAGGAAAGRRRARRPPTRSSPAATATRRATCWCSPPSAASSRSRCCPAIRTCWPRRSTPRGASRRGPSATCCCGARGWG